MSDYTPTTDEVRGVYVVHGFRDCHRSAVETEHQSTGGFSAEFDRWLAAHDADTREQIAHEIEALMVGPAVSITDPLPWDWKRAGMLDMQKLAARIARGEGLE